MQSASSTVMKCPPVAIVKGCYGRSICCHGWWHKELMAYTATSFKPKILSMLVLFSENERVPSEKQKEGMTYWCNFALFYIYNTQLHTVLVSRARLSPCESLACETNTVYWALYAGWSMGGAAVTWQLFVLFPDTSAQLHPVPRWPNQRKEWLSASVWFGPLSTEISG